MYKFDQAFTPGRIVDFIKDLNISNYQLVPKDPFEILYKKENENPFHSMSRTS